MLSNARILESSLSTKQGRAAYPYARILTPCTHAKLRLTALPTGASGQSWQGDETGEIGGVEVGGQANAQAPRSPRRLEARLINGAAEQTPQAPPEALTNGGERGREPVEPVPGEQQHNTKPRTHSTTVLLFLDCCLTSSFTSLLSFLVHLLTFLGIP